MWNQLNSISQAILRRKFVQDVRVGIDLACIDNVLDYISYLYRGGSGDLTNYFLEFR